MKNILFVQRVAIMVLFIAVKRVSIRINLGKKICKIYVCNVQWDQNIYIYKIIHTLWKLCSDREIEFPYNELICLRTESLSVKNLIPNQFHSTQLRPKSVLTYKPVYIVVNRMDLEDSFLGFEFLFYHLWSLRASLCINALIYKTEMICIPPS